MEENNEFFGQICAFTILFFLQKTLNLSDAPMMMGAVASAAGPAKVSIHLQMSKSKYVQIYTFHNSITIYLRQIGLLEKDL